MPIWLRRSLIALCVLAALGVASVVYLVATFNPERYKGLLVDWVREHRQRTLAIGGPVGLRFFPRLEVTLRNVTLSEHASPAEFAAFAEAALAVQVLPLLREQWVVDRVSARGVRVNYTRDAAGRSNIDDLLTTAESKPAAPATTTSASPAKAFKFDISAISISELQATVNDAKSALNGRFVVQELSTGRIADGAESPFKFKGRAELAQPQMNAALELDGKLKLTLAPDQPPSVALADLNASLRGEAFAIKQLDAALTGALTYDGPKGTVLADHLSLRVSGQRAGLTLQEGTVKVAALRSDPAQRVLQLDALDIKLAAKQGDSAFSASISWPHLEVNGEALKGSALKGSASLQGQHALQMSFESQAPAGNFERIVVPGLTLQITGSGAGRTERGEAKTNLVLTPQPLAIGLDALSLTLNVTEPALPPLTLKLSGSAHTTASDANWVLAGAINDQRFDSSGGAGFANAVPRISAKAQFAALDLARFIAPPAAAKAAPAAPGADKPVDLGALKALDGDISLRVGTLVYPPYRVADAALDATLAGGVLRVSQLAGRAWGGRFKAQATADAHSQRVAAQFEANDVDIAQLLNEVAQYKKLDGKGRVTANVNTHGASVQQFKRQLAGKAALELRDGALHGINLAKTLREWRSAIGLNKDAVQASKADEKTDFSEISASFDIEAGVARNHDLSAKSPFLRVAGDGLIDIGQGHVDYLAKATVTGSGEGQGGADLAMLKGVTVPVRLVGPFEAVDYKVQWSAVSADLLRGAARGALGDKAKGALSGLLGGAAMPAGAASSSSAKEQVQDAAKVIAKDKAKEQLKKLFGR